MGASTIRAMEKATPYAARFSFGSGSLATMEARIGPSVAIMNQVAAKGNQRRKILR